MISSSKSNTSKPPLWKEVSLEVNNIAILCWGKLGDMIATIPVSKKIRECFPDATITLIGNDMAKEVYQHSCLFNQTMIWPHSPTKLQKLRFMRMVAKQNFDLVIDQYSGDRSKLTSIFSRAKYRVGFYKNDFITKLAYNITTKRKLIGSWYQDFREILKALDIDTSSMKNTSYFYFDSHQQKKRLAQFNLSHQSYWVINLGAALDEKQYPVKNFVEIANYLLFQNQLIVIIYNPDKPHLQKNFKKEIDANEGLIFLPPLELDSLAGIIQKAKGLISVDTGIMHLACALKTPTIALFVGISQKVFIDESPFYALIEKNQQIPSVNEVIEKIQLELNN